jgi:hypothetical protein
METYPRKMEANPEEMKSIAVHQEVPKEGAAVQNIGALVDRYGDRHLAAGHCRRPQKRIQGEGKEFSFSRILMTRLVVPVRRKRRSHKDRR